MSENNKSLSMVDIYGEYQAAKKLHNAKLMTPELMTQVKAMYIDLIKATAFYQAATVQTVFDQYVKDINTLRDKYLADQKAIKDAEAARITLAGRQEEK